LHDIYDHQQHKCADILTYHATTLYLCLQNQYLNNNICTLMNKDKTKLSHRFGIKLIRNFFLKKLSKYVACCWCCCCCCCCCCHRHHGIKVWWLRVLLVVERVLLLVVGKIFRPGWCDLLWRRRNGCVVVVWKVSR